MVGIDAAEPLRDYTPWWHPAYKQGAPDFGGGAGTFLDEVVLPVLDAARHELGLDVDAGRTALFGYSLAGLFCLNTLMLTDAFGTYLVASPSTWYPGFVNRLARSAVDVTARVAIACGVNEGLDHPEPICGIRQETDRAVAALTERLAVPPSMMIDSRDHHSVSRGACALSWAGWGRSGRASACAANGLPVADEHICRTCCAPRPINKKARGQNLGHFSAFRPAILSGYLPSRALVRALGLRARDVAPTPACPCSDRWRAARSRPPSSRACARGRRAGRPPARRRSP